MAGFLQLHQCQCPRALDTAPGTVRRRLVGEVCPRHGMEIDAAAPPETLQGLLDAEGVADDIGHADVVENIDRTLSGLGDIIQHGVQFPDGRKMIVAGGYIPVRRW